MALRQADSSALEWVWVVSLAALAGARVFLGAATLPLFTNVDEQAHFDLVHKYARGCWPGKSNEDDRLDEPVIHCLALHGTWEYLNRPTHGFPLPARLQPEAQVHWLAILIPYWERQTNRGAFSPPVYYVLAGGWYDLGKLLGLREARLAFWGRFLNVPLYVILVLVAYLFCRRSYPGNRFLCWTVPLLVAFFPQDIFYGYSNDVLSPLLFGTALIFVLEWGQRGPNTLALGAATGLAVGLTFLTKYTNLAILVLFGAVVLRQSVRGRGEMPGPALWGKLFLAVAAASIPILLWVARNLILLGDPLGTRRKVELLGWTPKPLSELGQHPLLTLHGLGHYWSRLMERFWRGELFWYGEERAAWFPDQFFVWSSALLLAAAVVAWFVRRRQAGTVQRADGLALAAVGLSVLFLMGLSTLYDFGSCVNPSRAEPYFTSGRLISGVLIPFLVLYVRGLEFFFSRIGRAFMPHLVVSTAILAMIYSDLDMLLKATPSSFNWFHLP
jgi:hypothetical protein